MGSTVEPSTTASTAHPTTAAAHPTTAATCSAAATTATATALQQRPVGTGQSTGHRCQRATRSGPITIAIGQRELTENLSSCDPLSIQRAVFLFLGVIGNENYPDNKLVWIFSR